MHISFEIADSTMFEGFGRNRATSLQGHSILMKYRQNPVSSATRWFRTLPSFDATCHPQESSSGLISAGRRIGALLFHTGITQVGHETFLLRWFRYLDSQRSLVGVRLFASYYDFTSNQATV